MRGKTVEDFGFQQLAAIRAGFGDAARPQVVRFGEVELRDCIADLTQQHQRPRQRVIVRRCGLLFQRHGLLGVRQCSRVLACRPVTPCALSVLCCVL